MVENDDRQTPYLPSNFIPFDDSMFLQESNRVLNIWNSMSLARSIAAIIGWIMIGLNTSDNMLYNHLIELEKYQQNNN